MVYGIIALLALLVDQFLKFWTVSNVALNTGIRPLIPGFLHITYIKNFGAAFGVMSSFGALRWILLILLIAFTALMVFAFIKGYFRTGFVKVSGALLLAGLLGNGIDRAIYGYVPDIFELELFKFPIFNLADVLVLIGGILGLNVFVVLLIGIAAGAAITLITGQVTALELMGNMGGGVSGMFETILVTLLVASLCGLIRAYGGFESILAFIRRVFRGKRGGQLGIGLLVGLMDIATANNTVAIVMAGPIAKEVAEEYGISSKRSASLLDTFSCIFQGILPYGAQMLVALSTCATLGYAVSAFDIIPLLFYPFLLCLSSLLFILFDHQ